MLPSELHWFNPALTAAGAAAAKCAALTKQTVL